MKVGCIKYIAIDVRNRIPSIKQIQKNQWRRTESPQIFLFNYYFAMLNPAFN